MIAVQFAWFLNFIVLFVFNPIVAAVGLGPLFYFFALIGVFSTIFSIKYLPETNGLAIDVIQTLLVPKKKIPKS